MSQRIVELELAFERSQDNKISKILKEAVKEHDDSIVGVLKKIVENEKENGFIISETTKAYCRLVRKDLHDCKPLFELWEIDQYSVQESLLDVLGYDKVIPTLEEQKRIIDKYFYFGDKEAYPGCTDPRYGLAAACAGWDWNIVEKFLLKCVAIPDAPLKYVAENSLKKKYVRLR